MPENKLFLFIFEPYEWDYCGGAIGAIAGTYVDAVNLITNIKSTDGVKRFKSKMFSKDKRYFKKDHYDQWLLTNTIEIVGPEQSRIVFNNWNYA